MLGIFTKMRNSPNKGKSRGRDFLHSLVGYTGDECVTWPMFRDPTNGYGRVTGLGFKADGSRKIDWAHRAMCELAHGNPPTPKHEAAHSCGHGHLGCVNPKHLSWKTRSENQRDRYIHNRGQRNYWGRKGKLTRDQVAEIKALEGQKGNMEIASMYGVSPGNIRQIFLGQIWANVKPHI